MSEIFDTLDKNFIRFENKTIRVIIDDNDEIWFNANDTADALGYTDPRDTIKKAVELDEKKYLSDINAKIKIGSQPKTIYLSESGLYNLIFQSTLPKAKKFKKWVTDEVLPSIRKYGSYKLKQQYETDLEKILKDMDFLKKEIKLLHNDMKKDCFPDGGLVYVVNFGEDEKEMYRLGKTDDMKHRKSIYDTHTLHKRDVSHYIETDFPPQLEACVKAMLYQYRYKDRRDVFECKLQKVKNAFKRCMEIIKYMNCEDSDLEDDVQKGGGSTFIMKEINKLSKKKNTLNEKIKSVKQKLK